VFQEPTICPTQRIDIHGRFGRFVQLCCGSSGKSGVEGAFFGSILLENGQTVLERIESERLLSLPPPPH
jgi:hypothetical protein